jgi:prophage regulatory protein
MEFITVQREINMTIKKRFNRKPTVLDQFGFSKSTLANKINEGVFVPPCSLGARSVAWLEYELDALASAMAAGRSKEQLKTLVTELVAQRQQAI